MAGGGGGWVVMGEWVVFESAGMEKLVDCAEEGPIGTEWKGIRMRYMEELIVFSTMLIDASRVLTRGVFER